VESKEHLAGFWTIETANLDAAHGLAARERLAEQRGETKSLRRWDRGE
jgi:hypothetical protein